MTFSTGLSALRANQTALSVTGNNIANASTEGFRRQQVLFVEKPHVEQGGFSVGTGVSISEIRRVGDAIMESALLESASSGGMLTSRLQQAKHIESLFLPGTGTLQERVDELFSNMVRLSGLPADPTLRAAVVHSATNLSDEVNRIAGELEKMTSGVDRDIHQTIALINDKAAVISGLNKQIVDTENSGREAHGLRNQRDSILNELAELIDVERRVNAGGEESFVMGGGLFSLEHGLSDMELVRTESGDLEVWKEGCDEPHTIEGGKLSGLLAQNNDPGGINDLKSTLGEFTGALTQFIDGAHVTGVGVGGAFSSLTSGRAIQDSDATLATLDTITPTTAGSLFVSVNNQATGEIEVAELNIAPQSQSLNDVASQIGALAHLSASVDSSGRIAIVAESGYTFDFTGNLQTKPDATSLTGTSRPSISGRYAGSNNDEYTFRFLGDGTIGVTEGLQVEVLDGSNLTVRVLDVGRDYEAGTELTVGQGVSLAMTSGSVTAAEEFSLKLSGQPDETGILTALGLNTLFVGSEPGSLEVNPDIAANPSLLATTTSGDPSDTRNLHRMIALRDARLMRDGTITIEQFVAQMAADAGQEVSELTRDVEGQAEQQAFLQSEFDAVVGVDVNEELAKMLQYQRNYQAAARYIASVDQMLQELFTIIR